MTTCSHHGAKHDTCTNYGSNNSIYAGPVIPGAHARTGAATRARHTVPQQLYATYARRNAHTRLAHTHAQHASVQRYPHDYIRRFTPSIHDGSAQFMDPAVAQQPSTTTRYTGNNVLRQYKRQRARPSMMARPPVMMARRPFTRQNLKTPPSMMTRQFPSLHQCPDS